MRKKKRYAQSVKRIMRPELTHCLECQRKLQRCVTISDRMIITLKQVIRLAASVTSTAQAALLCIVLFIRLREKVKMDRGMQRLQQQRESAKRRRIQTEHLTPEPQKPEEETAT